MAPLLGRSRDLGTLRTALDRSESSRIVVSGVPGVGKTAVVRAAAADFAHVYHRAPPLPDREQRAALADTLRGGGLGVAGVSEDELPSDASWDVLFAAAAAGGPPGAPAILIVDDAHRWLQARSRFQEPLLGALRRRRREDRTLHVILIAPEPVAAEPDPESDEAPLLLRMAPLTFRSALPLLPGGDARERLQAYALLGGIPGHLRHLDPEVSLATNVRRCIFDPGAPLADRGLSMLEQWAQTPSRYAAVLAALSSGEADWSTVHQGVSDLTASGQVAPYLKRLEEMGMLEVRRSLDAGPRSRNRRYRITDPFFAFWFRHVLPHRHLEASGEMAAVWSDHVRPDLDGRAAAVLGEVCRQYMAHDALELLGANAREVGSLWGAGYDIPVAGILASGAAFYGQPLLDPGHSADAVEALDRQVRETRYGFGRELRLKILFCVGGVPMALARQVARRHDVEVVDSEALAGER